MSKLSCLELRMWWTSTLLTSVIDRQPFLRWYLYTFLICMIDSSYWHFYFTVSLLSAHTHTHTTLSPVHFQMAELFFFFCFFKLNIFTLGYSLFLFNFNLFNSNNIFFLEFNIWYCKTKVCCPVMKLHMVYQSPNKIEFGRF